MKRIFYHIMILFLIILILISGLELYRHYSEAMKSADEFRAVASLVKEESTQPTQAREDSSTEPAVTESTISEKYLAVYEENKDFVGWLTIEGTDIDYPVMQTPEDPDCYLKRAFDGSYSCYGVPYMQENCVIGESDNLIIYGHNMNNGTMFADLREYEDRDFYENHKIIRFDTFYEKGEYEILAVFKTEAYSDSGFAYHKFVDAQEEADFVRYIDQCRELSLYDTGVTAQYGDQLLTLSTCEYSQTNGRMVIVAKRMI